MAKVTQVRKNGKPTVTSVSTGNGRGPGCPGKRQRAGLCPAQNAASQIANKRGR